MRCTLTPAASYLFVLFVAFSASVGISLLKPVLISKTEIYQLWPLIVLMFAPAERPNLRPLAQPPDKIFNLPTNLEPPDKP